MRYSTKSLEINVVISGNVLLFKDIRIGLGLLITAREMHALSRENLFLEVSTNANNRITVSAVEPKIPSKSYYLASYLIQINIINIPGKSSGCRWRFILFFFSFSVQNNHLLTLPFKSEGSRFLDHVPPLTRSRKKKKAQS